MNKKERLKKIKEAVFKCDVCGSMNFFEGLIYKGNTYALCENCTFQDLLKKLGETR